jgi:hypothetical protein
VARSWQKHVARQQLAGLATAVIARIFLSF